MVISIIVRTYNSAKFVANAIESILHQDVDPTYYEILVVDDGSTDNTIEVLGSYGSKIRIIKGDHQGAIAALNRGIQEARGNYITILDSDDTFEQGIVKAVADIFQKDGAKDFVYTDYREISVDGTEKIVSLAENIFNGVSAGVFIKKEILNAIGGYDESLIFPEYDVIIKLAEKYQGFHLALPGFIYKRRRESLTGSKELVKKGKQQLLLKYNKNFPIRDY
jgi:glycosyltransferase involved in cell wall biosynthesis